MRILLGDGIRQKKEASVEEQATVDDVMKQQKLTGQTVVCVLNGKITHPATVLREGDELELVGVIYGG